MCGCSDSGMCEDCYRNHAMRGGFKCADCQGKWDAKQARAIDALSAARKAEAEAVEACVTFMREIAGQCFDEKKQPLDTGMVESLVENLDAACAEVRRLGGMT